MLANETGNSVTLLGQEGKQQTILRTDLEVLQATGKSLMPEGLEKDLEPAGSGQRDRLSARLGRAAQDVPGQPSAVGQADDRRHACNFMPPIAKSTGRRSCMERLYKNLGKWQSENDRAVWNVEVPKAGRYAMWLNYSASTDDNAGNTWLLEAGDKTLTGKVAGHRQQGLSTRKSAPARSSWRPASGQIVFRSAGPIKGDLIQLGGVLLKPVPVGK